MITRNQGILATVTAFALLALSTAVPAQGGDWPQFRGPDRDGVSRETGLATQWPEGGPAVAWRVDGNGPVSAGPQDRQHGLPHAGCIRGLMEQHQRRTLSAFQVVNLTVGDGNVALDCSHEH